jgi:ADP-ribose pyrophosphatase YjhB (NUDIX family)
MGLYGSGTRLPHVVFRRMMMLLDIMIQIWRRFRGSYQWRLLWLFNSKFMVSVAGIVEDRNGRVLLLRHRHWVPDVWGFPGGIVQSGESLEDAFSREVFEETGLVISSLEFIKWVSGYKLRMEVLFRAKITGEDPHFQIQENEILEARFFSMDRFPTNMLETQRALLRQGLSNK